MGEEITRIAGASNFNGINLLNDSAFTVRIQFGGATDYIDVAGTNVTETGLGINTLSIASDASAQGALGTLDSAISLKDTSRSRFGYMMNRLESTITVINIQAENLQTSESRISDVDVATEMAEMTRNQVLAQAGTAMLAQANTMPQMALTLLR
jgi:flagellin